MDFWFWYWRFTCGSDWYVLPQLRWEWWQWTDSGTEASCWAPVEAENITQWDKEASSHDRILSLIWKLTSSPTGRAVIGGKSAGDRSSAIFMCELHNDASKRLTDTSPTPNKYFLLLNTSAYYRYRGSQQQHHLSLCTDLYLVLLKKFQFSKSFSPRFNMYFYEDWS